MENPIEMDDFGVPLFSETSIWEEDLVSSRNQTNQPTNQPTNFDSFGITPFYVLNIFVISETDSNSHFKLGLKPQKHGFHLPTSNLPPFSAAPSRCV